jgi:hypothetical protein
MNAPDPTLSPADTKAALLEALRAIQTRQDTYSFRLVQAKLRTAGMQSAQGWVPLLAKYEKTSLKEPKLTEWLQHARDIFWTTVTCGRRAVVVFEVTPEQLALFEARAEQELIDLEVDFAETFPFPVEDDVLRQASYNGKFVYCNTSPDGDDWYFACAKRSFRRREPIIVQDLDEEARDALDGFDEVIGIKSGVVQAYDAVVVRHDALRVEIHIDLCCPMTTEDIRRAHLYYTRLLNHDVIASDDVGLRLIHPHNFFPDIDRLYNDANGVVTSLGHATGTKSIKDERMRSKNLDLRTESFHKEGMREIGETDAFSIRKGWQVPHKLCVPTAIIPGHFSLAEQVGATIDFAIVENCFDYEDFDFVMGHLIKPADARDAVEP